MAVIFFFNKFSYATEDSKRRKHMVYFFVSGKNAFALALALE